MSEPTCISSGIASHCTNLRESPPTTSQQASAAYERHDLPPRSVISRIGLNSVRAICRVDAVHVLVAIVGGDELAHLGVRRLERHQRRHRLAHLFADGGEEVVEVAHRLEAGALDVAEARDRACRAPVPRTLQRPSQNAGLEMQVMNS